MGDKRGLHLLVSVLFLMLEGVECEYKKGCVSATNIISWHSLQCLIIHLLPKWGHHDCMSVPIRTSKRARIHSIGDGVPSSLFSWRNNTVAQFGVVRRVMIKLAFFSVRDKNASRLRHPC